MKPSKNNGKKPFPFESQGELPPRAELPPGKPERAEVVVIHTERRSWLALVVTGFGAVLLRYLRSVRQRTRHLRL